MLPQLASAHDFVVDGIYYLKNGNEATVTYKGNSYSSYDNEYSGNVNIPSTVTYNGTTYDVTAIGEYAFYNCTGLQSVNIPNSVITIGERAFYNCNNLKFYVLTIPNSVKNINVHAFHGCTALQTVNFGNSLEAISGAAFKGCTRLKNINIPNSVTWLGGNAFADCTSLTTVTIGESVTGIGEDRPFNGCTALKTVNWNAKSCPDFSQASTSPFYELTGITTFNFGSSVQKIPAYLCQGMTGITSITIPASVTTNAINFIHSKTLHFSLLYPQKPIC